jgi:S-(hydroxymethyl)glutathione dehydrogenase/alcohol dehydrogenase
MYLAGQLRLDDLVGRRIALDEVNEAYDEMRAGGHARPVIDFTL